MKEKKYLIYGITIVLLTIIGVTLAYFITEIEGDKKDVTLNTGDLRVIFNNGEKIEGVDIEPGWSVTKTFSIENKSKTEYKYNIVIQDLVNTFVSDNLVYKITSTNNGHNMTDYEVLPKSDTQEDTILTYSTTISGKTTQEYTIEVKFKEEDRNQYEDMGKTITGKIYITEGNELLTLTKAILRDNPTISERTDFSVTNTETTTGTIYKTIKTEDDSEVFYYSGNTTNNWVKFGKYQTDLVIYRGYDSSTSTSYYIEYSNMDECTSAPSYNKNCTEYKYASAGDDIYWRIIRTNEDGSIRLLYSGTSPDTTEGYIGRSKFNENNNDPMYVGYMYGTTGSLANNRTNENDSTIKAYIDTWYKNNLLNNYDVYISKSAIYCNDRSLEDESKYTAYKSIDNINKNLLAFVEKNEENKNTILAADTVPGINERTFDYGASTRLYDNKTPSYKCGANTNSGLFESTQALADKFSVITSGGGNGKLTYPIALMTADEVAFAGGKGYGRLSSPYAWYYTNSVSSSITNSTTWYLLSPSGLVHSACTVFAVYGSDIPGQILDPDLIGFAVRPVISLKSCTLYGTGNGTAENPYTILETESGC